jgi:hypothetical protein
MDWTPLSLNTLITQIPKLVNDNFTAFKLYMDVFYDETGEIFIKPVTTTGRVKGATGEFVNVIVDNLTVKNQWTNRFENATTADYDYWQAYTEVAVVPRDPCIYGIDTSLWNFPYEPSGYKIIDVNKPYYKITNDYPLFLGNENVSQVVGIIFDASVIEGDNFQILIDPCAGTTYDIDASEGGEAYIEFIATSFDASWGSTWEQYRYGIDDPSTQNKGFVGPGTIDYIPIFTNTYKIEDSSLYIDSNGNLQVDASIYQQGKLIEIYDPSLSNSLAMPEDVGGLLADTSIAFLRGNTFEYLFNELLFPTVLASSTSNTTVLSGISTATMEVGTGYAPSTIGTYTTGQITNGDDAVGPGLTGDASQYIFILPSDAVDHTYTASANTQAHTFSSYDISFGSNQWSVNVVYDACTSVYYDNKGNAGSNLDTLRVDSSLSDNSSTVTGRRVSWSGYGVYGSAPSNSAGVRALTNEGYLSATNTGTFDITIPAATQEVYFYIPIDKTVVVQYVESSYADVTADFSTGSITVNDAGALGQSYESWESSIGGVGYPSIANYRITIT